jgi:hypothetical protein
MKNLKLKNLNLILLALVFLLTASYGQQAEYPAVVNNYLKINDNSKKINASNIRKCTELMLVKGRQDTLKINYYDKAGNLSQQYLYLVAAGDKAGIDYHNSFYLYGKDGRLMQKIDSSSNEIKRIVISYDDVGNISKEEVKSKNEVIKEISYEYDNLSRLIESTEKDLIGSCKIVEQYAYDSYNNLAKLTVKNSCNNSISKSLVTTISYKYDAKYNIIEKQSAFPSGGFKNETFKYDAKGLLVESYESTGPDSYNKVIYEHDIPNGIVKSEKTEVVGEVQTRFNQVFKYDKNGNLLEEKYSGPKGEEIYTRKNIYEYY